MMTIQKIPVVLESPRDWEDWYDVVRSSAHARGVLTLVDVNATTPSGQLTAPAEPRYSAVNADATSYADLTASEKDHYKVLISEY